MTMINEIKKTIGWLAVFGAEFVRHVSCISENPEEVNDGEIANAAVKSYNAAEQFSGMIKKD